MSERTDVGPGTADYQVMPDCRCNPGGAGLTSDVWAEKDLLIRSAFYASRKQA